MPLFAPRAATCSICGARDSTTMTGFGDRHVPACALCGCDEPPQEGYPIDLSLSSRAVRLARSCQGLTSQELCDELGLIGSAPSVDLDRNTVSNALGRAMRSGYLTAEGAAHMQRRYFRGPKPWTPHPHRRN